MTLKTPLPALLPPHIAVINGSGHTAGSGELLEHIYPANGQVSAEYRIAGEPEVEAAVAAARAAFPAWRALSGDRKRDLLLKLASVIEQHSNELAALELLGSGSPIMMGSYIPPVIAQRFRYYAGAADRIRGDTLDAWNGPAHNYVNYEPYGVIGAIIPWNGPLFAAAMVIAPALAAGNCVVLKAPELSPFPLCDSPIYLPKQASLQGWSTWWSAVPLSVKPW